MNPLNRLLSSSLLAGAAAVLRAESLEPEAAIADGLSRAVVRGIEVKVRAIDFTLTGDLFVFSVTEEVETDVRLTLESVGSVSEHEDDSGRLQSVAIHGDRFDEFSRHLAASGIFCREKTLHRTALPTGGAILQNYFNG